MADYFFHGQNLPLQDSATLLQAARWIAAYIPPTPYEYNAFTQDMWPTDTALKQAKLKLCYNIMIGEIKVKGYECFQHSEEVQNFIRKPPIKLNAISQDFWSYNSIQWDDNALVYYQLTLLDTGVYDIKYRGTWNGLAIGTSELMRLYPKAYNEDEQNIKANKLHKSLCRAVAQTLWHLNPALTAEDIIKHHAILEFGAGKNYGGKNTIRDWIREVDPRPPEKKRGRKTKG